MPYLLVFCRLTIGLLFAYSFVGKVRDVAAFAQTITSFKLLPSVWSRPVALLFLGGELAVVILLLLGGQLLPLAFGFTLLLLLAFTAALVSVLTRNIQTTCNCFGSSQKPVAYIDVGRNIGLAVVATIGLWTAGTIGNNSNPLAPIELLLIAMIAGSFVLVWTNVRDAIALFQSI